MTAPYVLFDGGFDLHMCNHKVLDHSFHFKKNSNGLYVTESRSGGKTKE